MFILKRHLLKACVSLLLVAMSMGAVRSQPTPYTFLADSWKIVGGDKSGHEINLTYYRVSVPDGTRTQIAYNADKSLGVTLSPDGQKAIAQGIWIGNKGQLINLWDASTQTFGFKTPLSPPQVWSPDSKSLAVIAHPDCDCETPYAELGVVNAETGALQILTQGEFLSGDVQGIAWSADASQIAYLDQRYDAVTAQYTDRISVIPADGSQSPRTLFSINTADGLYAPELRWMPEGNFISLTAGQLETNDVWIIGVAKGNIDIQYQTTGTLDTCWSRQTDHFVVASEINFGLITPHGTSHLDTHFVDPTVWHLKPGSTHACAWSSDGAKLALIYDRGYPTPVGVKIIDFEAREVRDIQPDSEWDLLEAYWSPDSQLLALKTIPISRDPTAVTIYDSHTTEAVMTVRDINFIAWLSAP